MNSLRDAKTKLFGARAALAAVDRLHQLIPPEADNRYQHKCLVAAAAALLASVLRALNCADSRLATLELFEELLNGQLEGELDVNGDEQSN